MKVTLIQKGLVLESNQNTWLIDFEKKSLTQLKEDQESEDGEEEDLSISCLGVFGVFPIGVHFLAVITNHEQVASLRNEPIYKITGALLIPLSYHRARATITTTLEESNGRLSTDSQKSTEVPETTLAGSPCSTSPSTLKFLRECQKLLFSGSLFYSPSINLHQSLRQGLFHPETKSSSYYFNYNRNRLFEGTEIELKIIQGFVGQIEVDFGSIILISRRSNHRIGARYLRRGIDDDSNCANWVETEQLLVTLEKIFSYVIVRGSLPVFFQQSPYRLKPTARLLRGKDATRKVFKTHFDRINQHYGSTIAVNLVEASPASTEFQVGDLYSKLCQHERQELEWFDFHHACKGMKFERVGEIFDSESIQNGVNHFRWNGLNLETDTPTSDSQSGVFRVNCIDCLDRTNVVQTEIAKKVLEMQLLELDIKDFVVSSSYYHMWADNGDAISRQYSNTNALKGEFTRNRKRDLKGVVTDMGLMLTRFYSGVVSDFFRQALLDFIVGNVDERVFREFDDTCACSDPRLYSNSAIEVASGICQEDVISGWWLESVYNSTDKYIVLLTDTSIYVCRFDFMTERVSEFEKIDVDSISKILFRGNSQVVISTSDKPIQLKIPTYNAHLDSDLRKYCLDRKIEIQQEEEQSDTFVSRIEKRLKRLIWA